MTDSGRTWIHDGPTPSTHIEPPVTPGNVTRRLSAIVIADVAGYSRLMERNETATNARLRTLREGLIAAKAMEYGGRIVDTAGDGFLLEFASATFAVRCAITIQREMRSRNRRSPPDMRIEFRIGINLGDVIVDGDDIAGNGINVAARLEALCDPGGICLSASVRDQLHDDLAVEFIDIGEQRVKSLERPVRAYRMTLLRKTRSLERRSAGDLTPPTSAPAARRDVSIAVLPFTNLSSDPANEYFADGLAEELLNVLAGVQGLRVVPRTSSFYFKGKQTDLATVAAKLNVSTVLEGSVRASDKRIRVTVQLIDVASDSHLWSTTFDRTVDDIFAIQDEIAQAVVHRLRPGTTNDAAEAAGREYAAAVVGPAPKGRTTNSEALRLYVQGRYFAARQTHGDTAKALECYERALKIDEHFAVAWSALASAHAAHSGYGGTPSVAEGFRRARAAAQRALWLEPGLGSAHVILSWIQLYGDWDWKGADQSWRRAVEVAPSDVGVLKTSSIIAGNIGHEAEAVEMIRHASVLDPLDATTQRAIAMLELDYMHLEAADTALARAIECDPGLGLAYFTLGSIRMAQGRLVEALAAFQRETLEDYRMLGATLAWQAQGRPTEAAAALHELVDRYGSVSPSLVAEAYTFRGEIDLAFEWLDRAYTARDPRLVEAPSSPLLRGLHSDGRWKAFLERMGLGD